MTAALAVLALAIVCLVAFFIMETRPKKTISMLDLAEFKELPAELRSMIKSIMPNPSALKKQWASMTPQQKQAVLHSVAHQIPRPQPPPPPRPPAPSMLIKPEPMKPEPSGIKPGFLLSKSVDKSKKKNTYYKKDDQIVTLSDVGASEDEAAVIESAEVDDGALDA
jgi:hypothetical protein